MKGKTRVKGTRSPLEFVCQISSIDPDYIEWSATLAMTMEVSHSFARKYLLYVMLGVAGAAAVILYLLFDLPYM
jgi:hypothetical protein